MDVRHKQCWVRVSTGPRSDDINFDSPSVILACQQLTRALHESASRFNGPIEIIFSPHPIQSIKPKLNSDFALTQGIDPSLIIDEEDLPESDQEKLRLARQAQQDPLLVEYRSLGIRSVRESTPPERIGELKQHMDKHYFGTEHWDGVHKW